MLTGRLIAFMIHANLSINDVQESQKVRSGVGRNAHGMEKQAEEDLVDEFYHRQFEKSTLGAKCLGAISPIKVTEKRRRATRSLKAMVSDILEDWQFGLWLYFLEVPGWQFHPFLIYGYFLDGDVFVCQAEVELRDIFFWQCGPHGFAAVVFLRLELLLISVASGFSEQQKKSVQLRISPRRH